MSDYDRILSNFLKSTEEVAKDYKELSSYVHYYEKKDEQFRNAKVIILAYGIDFKIIYDMKFNHKTTSNFREYYNSKVSKDQKIKNNADWNAVMELFELGDLIEK